MVRPRRCRRVTLNPEFRFFKPQGIPLRELEESVLTIEEVEALRLSDLNSLSQIDCAKEMHISQPTFHRIIQSARKKISEAIVNGKAIKISGGHFKIENEK